MNFGSVCSGIEAASVAWHPLGWKASWLAEIEKFPSSVLAHHYPNVANLGDMTKIAVRIMAGEIEAPDVLVGGTPCQAFSVAGLRKSLDDERGQLSISFIHLADAIDAVRSVSGRSPAVIVWENVPGVLSTSDNAFGCFLAGLVGEERELQPAGKKWSNAGCVYGPKRAAAWRVLDAQYFGVAQRRRRVFVVASARDWIDPAEVLFERDRVRRDSAPSREAGEATSHATAPCLTSSGRGVERTGDTRGQDPVIAVASTGSISHCLNAGGMGRQDFETETLVTHSLRGEGFDASEDGTGRGTPLVPVSFGAQMSNPQTDFDIAQTLQAKNPAAVAAIGWSEELTASHELAGTLQRGGDGGRHDGVMTPAMQVRRLTPTECERLQGFPDDYTRIPWKIGYWPEEKHSPEVRAAIAEQCPDGPRYKALGNSMAVPVMRWIGKRIQEVMA